MFRTAALKTKRAERLSVSMNTGSGLLRAFPAESGMVSGR